MFTLPAIITIIVIVLAIGFLLFSKIRPDLIALMVLLSLGLTQVVTSTEAFSGFSSTAVMTILGISMVSVALQQTGAANALGKLIFKIGGKSEWLTIFFVTLASATLSLFMNNIASVGILLPAVMSLSRRSRIPPSRLLMPLAFGTILGGMATLLTTANIIVSGALKQANISSFGLLDYFPVGGPVALVGILYITILGRKLLPKNAATDSGSFTRLSERLQEQYFHNRTFHRVQVLPGSSLAGKTLRQADLESSQGIQIVSLMRGKKLIASTAPEMVLQANDTLVVSGHVHEDKLAPLGLLDESPAEPLSLSVTDAEPMAEVMITPHSRLIGQSIREIDIRNRYSLNVLGIWRQGKPITENFTTSALQFGDALLVQGPALKVSALHHSQDMMLLEEDPDAVYRPAKIGLALIITLVTLTIAALDLFPVPLVILAGAVVLMLTGCMSIMDAFQKIEWKPIFLIAGMWPLTIALQKTGLAQQAIQSVIPTLSALHPIWVVTAFVLLAMLFTQFLSGPVAPIIITPLALQAAQSLSIDPHPLAMAVALGCSLAFIFPISHPVNVMVMNPAGYTFKDYLRAGLPLTLLAFCAIVLSISFAWGL